MVNPGHKKGTTTEILRNPNLSIKTPKTLAARGLEELFNNTVIDVTSLLHLWSCRINHNISATQTQPYKMDRQTDTLIRCGLGRGIVFFRSEQKCSNCSNSAMVRLVHVSGYSDRSHLADPGIIYLFSQKYLLTKLSSVQFESCPGPSVFTRHFKRKHLFLLLFPMLH
jgi:hypothetical protein